jgi:small-conductance mechanosensitive channel
MMQLKDIMEYSLFHVGDVNLRVFSIIKLVLLLAGGRLFIYFVQRLLNRQIKKENIDQRKGYAISQIITYLIWLIIVVLALDSLGLPITVLIAGSTALFVGLGLGLQDTFKDLIAGVIILMERTLTAGDIVELGGGMVGKVREVGLRTTVVETREDIVVIIPNQKLTSQNVINWTQNKRSIRFAIEVGVAYGSDTRLVEKILIECARKQPSVNKKQGPIVHFAGFGNSSLDFKLLFYSTELFRIEKIKSDIRFAIDQAFRDNGITIPFPQQDVHIKQVPPAAFPQSKSETLER